MTNLGDFHVHPDYSVDAIGTIRQFCDRGLETGIRHICFTTHYDANPRRLEQDGYWHHKGKRVRISDGLLDEYFAEIEGARQYFSQYGLKIYRGLEVDYFPGAEKETERLKGKFDIDFIIGSVHCLDDIAISDKKEAPLYFKNKSLSQMAADYFRLLSDAAEFGGFDCLAHLDYYVRYGREYYGNDIDNIELERFDPVFEILAKNGGGIEINTSPYRYAAKNFHPRREIIERAISSGVSIISVGSDSHKPENLGLGVSDAFASLAKLNIRPLFPKI